MTLGDVFAVVVTDFSLLENERAIFAIPYNVGLRGVLYKSAMDGNLKRNIGISSEEKLSFWTKF